MNADAARVFGILFVAAFLTGSTEGLTYYQCSAYKHWECEGGYANASKITTDLFNGACQTCTKSRWFGVMTRRSCSSEYAPSQCIEDTCNCNTDLCNASVTMATSIHLASLVVSLLVSAVFKI